MDSYIKKFLEENNIEYELYTHRAVFSCEESKIYCKHVPGISGKNLFLKDEKGKQFFLVVLPCKKKLDLNTLAFFLKVKKLKFANEQELKNILELSPGSVSILGLLNDKERKTELIIERSMWEAEKLNFHPNINTESLTFHQENFHKLVQILCKEYRIFE